MARITVEPEFYIKMTLYIARVMYVYWFTIKIDPHL